MPLWKVYHPAGAYTAEDKKGLAESITSMYTSIPIPGFYVVFIYEEVPEGNLFVSGKPHNKFVRFKIDHMARTLHGRVMREWWVRTIDSKIVPYVKDRGFDWEITIDELPADLWSLQGEIPPPFESAAEKRWVKEDRSSPYSLTESMPISHAVAFSPGITGSK